MKQWLQKLHLFQAEKTAGYEVVAQPLSQANFTISSDVTSKEKEKGPFDEADEFEVSYKITDMKSIGEQGIVGIGALLSYNRETLKLESITPGEGWTIDYNLEDNPEAIHNIAATYKIENEQLTKILAPEDGNENQLNKTVFTAKFMVLENENVTEKILLSHIEGSTGKDNNVVRASDVVTDITVEKVENPDIVEKLETTDGATCKIDGKYVKNVDIGLKVEEMKKQLTSGTVLPLKFFKHSENSEHLIELMDSDIVTTGTIIKVGESQWTIIVNGDLDGNGKLTVNDIVLFKQDYIGEKPLKDVFLMAADMDESSGATTINDLVLMIFKYNDIY